MTRKSEPPQQLPTVAIALTFGFVLLLGFFALIVVIIPGAIQMALIGALLFLFFAAQYLIWGNRLYRYAVMLESREQQSKGQSHRSSTDPSEADPLSG